MAIQAGNSLLTQILRHFPPNTHALTAASDPDGLLADESVLATLHERSFTVIDEADPVRLRYGVEQVRPFSPARPVIIVTKQPLNTLPFDLWQQAIRITISLHEYFPNLSYPLVKGLTPTQRWRLGQVSGPVRCLGRESTIEFLLRHIFSVNPSELEQPGNLVIWLNGYHCASDPMPADLADYLLYRLRRVPVYDTWPLVQLLESRRSFEEFMRSQWAHYVGVQSGQIMGEAPAPYLLAFESDIRLQDAISGLVRNGTLEPVQVPQPDQLPPWTRPAVVAEGEDRQVRRADELLSVLTENAAVDLTTARWEQWQTITRAWAELTILNYDAGSPLREDQVTGFHDVQTLLDQQFPEWLRHHYAALGGQRLPSPHHLFHIPHAIAYRTDFAAPNPPQRAALLIMDGMSFADWFLIRSHWQPRHPDWQINDAPILAQIPTVTAISRQALVSGTRPAEFATTLEDNSAEPGRWSLFWAQHDLPGSAGTYLRLRLDREDQPPELADNRIRALCLVDDTIDEIAHSSTLGAAGFFSSLRLWLRMDAGTNRLELVIQTLLAQDFTIYLSSDHGHTEARGMGQPNEGLTVQKRSKRARVYPDQRAAQNVQLAFPDTYLWGQDGLLPTNIWALMPKGRLAFAPTNDLVVTHGGLSLDEVAVPFVVISPM